MEEKNCFVQDDSFQLENLTRVTDVLDPTGDLKQKDIEALNIEVSGQDNKLFLDYVRILVSNTIFSKKAQNVTSSYFIEYSEGIQHPEEEKKERLANLFKHSKEEDDFVSANRLGLSEIKHGVKPIGKGPGDTIEKALSRVETQNLVSNGVIKDFSTVALFIPGINKDKTSDFLTSILKEVLTEFTTDLLVKYPSHKFEEQEVEEEVWDPDEKEWVLKTQKAYYYEEERIILVPKYWVSRNYEYTVRRLFSGIILENQLIKDAFQKKFQKLHVDKELKEFSLKEKKEIFEKVYGKPTKDLLAHIILELKQNNAIGDIDLTQYKLPLLDDQKLDYYILEPYLFH